MRIRATLTSLIVLFSTSLTVSSMVISENDTTTRSVSDGRVQVEVNLESLCPDSRRFVLRQLVPTFNDISDIMQVDIIPFGHARTLGNNKMICQHGARECEGNRRMACLISRAHGDQRLIVPTIGCLFSFEPPKNCIEQNLPQVSFDDIEKCKGSDESYSMMEKFEKMTGRIDYVPRIKIDGKFNAEEQEEADSNLRKLVCDKYKGQDKPKKCTDEPTATTE